MPRGDTQKKLPPIKPTGRPPFMRIARRQGVIFSSNPSAMIKLTPGSKIDSEILDLMIKFLGIEKQKNQQYEIKVALLTNNLEGHKKKAPIRQNPLNVLLTSKLDNYKIEWHKDRKKEEKQKANLKLFKANREVKKLKESKKDKEKVLLKKKEYSDNLFGQLEEYKVEIKALKDNGVDLVEDAAESILGNLALNVPAIKLITSSAKALKASVELAIEGYRLYKAKRSKELFQYGTPLYKCIQPSLYEHQFLDFKKKGLKALSETELLASNFIPGGQIISTADAVARAFVSIIVIATHYRELNEITNKIAGRTIELDDIENYYVLAGFYLNEEIFSKEDILGISKETMEIKEFDSPHGQFLVKIKENLGDLKKTTEQFEELVKEIHILYYSYFTKLCIKAAKKYPYGFVNKDKEPLWKDDETSKLPNLNNSWGRIAPKLGLSVTPNELEICDPDIVLSGIQEDYIKENDKLFEYYETIYNTKLPNI
jgi:hypothetical protein